MIFRKADVKKFSPGVIFYPLIGILLVYLMNLLPAGMFGSRVGSGFTHFFMLGLAGIITAVALVLPGISVSYMLLMLGMYEDTMYAVSYTHLKSLDSLKALSAPAAKVLRNGTCLLYTSRCV